MTSNNVRPRGFRSRQDGSGARVKFHCKVCNLDEPSMYPCRVNVVWGSFMDNPHLSQAGWVHKIRNGSEFLVYDTTGSEHPIVVHSGLEDHPDNTRAPDVLLLEWRESLFGSRSVLGALENSLNIKFRIEDQKHWFDEGRVHVVLKPDRVVPLVDTAGRTQKVVRPSSLSSNKMQAFLQWKSFLCEVAQRLLGVEDLDVQYKITPDASWTFHDVRPCPPSVDSNTSLQDWDWNYDANPAIRLEDHQREADEDG